MATRPYIIFFLSIFTFAYSGFIHPHLSDRLASLDGEAIRVIVHMKSQADLSRFVEIYKNKTEKI